MINLQQSNAISVLRVMAMISIISCHILQALDNHWAWVLNVGVQIFLVMSGYLYGHKQIKDWSDWFKNRLKKLYVPFVIFAILMLIIYKNVAHSEVDIKDYIIYILDVQGICGGYMGLNHLWFMTAIALCYIITPLLQIFRKYSSTILLLVLFLGILQFVFLRIGLSVFSWLFLYSVGYYFANVGKLLKILTMTMAALVVVIILNACDWSLMLILNTPLENGCMHISGGFLLFVCGLFLLDKVRFQRFVPLVRILDKYSFACYITHHVFIFGLFSMIYLTSNLIVNIVLVLMATFLSAFALSIFSQNVIHFIDKICSVYKA